MIDLDAIRREIADWYVHCEFPAADKKAWIEATPQMITAKRYPPEVLRLVALSRALIAEVDRLDAESDRLSTQLRIQTSAHSSWEQRAELRRIERDEARAEVERLRTSSEMIGANDDRPLCSLPPEEHPYDALCHNRHTGPELAAKIRKFNAGKAEK